jgi:vancomycin resistance protein YoaR
MNSDEQTPSPQGPEQPSSDDPVSRPDTAPPSEDITALVDQVALPPVTDPTEPTMELPREVLEPTMESPEEDFDLTLPTQALPLVEDLTQATAVVTQLDTALPVQTSELQPTAVIPHYEPKSPPGHDTPAPTEGLVPPPTDAGAAAGDTTDFTLTDVTLGGVGGDRVITWLRGSGRKLGSLVPGRRREETESAAGAQPKRTPWGLKVWQFSLVIGVAALVLLCAVFIAVDSGLYYDKVHHGVKVAGQSLSGMQTDEAVATLAEFVEEVQDRPVILTSGDQKWTVLPSDLDTTIDVQAAVSAAMDLTRGGNALADFGRKLKLYFGGEDIPLKGALDDAKMDLLLARIARQLDVPATNARLVIVNDTLEVQEGEPGSVVDKEALRTSLTSLLFTFHSTELDIPMMVDDADVQAVDITPALAQANVMISADLALTYEGETLVSFTPREIASYMDLIVKSEGGFSTTTPALSATKLSAVFDAIDDQVGTPGQNATMDSDGASLWVVPGEDGVGVDRQATATALTEAALLTAVRAAEVLMTSVPPDLTTRDVEALGIKDLLASYATTPYTGSAGRQQNVRLATSLCSGVLLAPGEEFDTDRRLGIRDAAHGWATAPGIVGFGEMEDVYGGGICQVSTTLFNAVLEAGLEIVQRHNHSIFINHYPDGRDATVTAGGKNMRFRNDTNHYIFIYGQSTGIKTKFYIWGASDGRTASISFSGFTSTGIHGETLVNNPALPPGTRLVKFEGQNGLECYIMRTVTYADGTTKTEKFKSRYPIIPAMIEVGPAVTTTTGGPTTTTLPTSTTLPPATTSTSP